jgi:hypothetical protein
MTMDKDLLKSMGVIPHNSDLPIENSIAVFKAVRTSSLEILKRISIAQLENAGVHSESGIYTVKNWLDTYIKHPTEHAEQIRSGL